MSHGVLLPHVPNGASAITGALAHKQLTPSALTQGKSMRYEPPAINFHLRETPPREPQGGGEHTECAATALRRNQRDVRYLNVNERSVTTHTINSG
jgi:hypothetical protein